MKKRGWLIYHQKDVIRNRSYIDWFIDEATKQNLILQLIVREELVIGVRDNKLSIHHVSQAEAPLPDFAVVRTTDPLLNLQLEKAGIAVFNKFEAANMANDKAIAHLHAASLGIPMLDTIFVKKGTLKEDPPFRFPVVIKQTDGRSGKQIRKVGSFSQWQEARELFFDQDTIIQRTNVMPGKDLRIFVIGKTIIAAVLRENDTDFRANISLGGTALLYSLSNKEKQLVELLIQSCDFGLVGVDFLFDSDGNLLFNEIEDPVGSRSLSQVSSINLLECFVSFIKKRLADDE